MQHMLKMATGGRSGSHAGSSARRLLYDHDGAMRSRHHRLFNSCWSVHERHYYQSASSARTPMTEELEGRLKAYAERQARCINGVKDWPAFLSNPDTLLITDTSTFGYIAAGLAGVRPYSLNIVTRYHSNWRKKNQASCSRTSPEPCYLSIFDAKSRHIQCPSSPPVTTLADRLTFSPSHSFCRLLSPFPMLRPPSPPHCPLASAVSQ
ncbi:unnamed protein product [Closterium sp. NIES-54]